MKQLRSTAPKWGVWAMLGLLAAILGCAGRFQGDRSSNVDLTLVSFGSLQGETAECG